MELEALEPRVQELDKRVTNLNSIKSEVSTSNQNIVTIRSKTKDITDKEGILEQIRINLDTQRHRTEEIRQLVESSSKLAQLLVIGLGYLSSERPHECPICQQSISLDEVVLSLESRNKTELAQRSQLWNLNGYNQKRGYER